MRARALWACALLLAACDAEPARSPARVDVPPDEPAPSAPSPSDAPPEPSPPEPSPSEPSPFAAEWMDAATWARLSAVEARERAALEAACPAAAEADQRARESLMASSAACVEALAPEGPIDVHEIVFPRRVALDAPIAVRAFDLRTLAPIDSELIARALGGCEPFLRALDSASLEGTGWFAAPAPNQALLTLARAGRGVSIEAWTRAAEGRPAEAARLVAQALRPYAALSRTGDGLGIAMLSQVEDWSALLASLEPSLDAAARREVGVALDDAVRSVPSARSIVAARLLADAARYRGSDETIAAPGWEDTILTLASLTDAPDAGIDAHEREVLSRWQRESDRMYALDGRRTAPAPEDRPLIVLNQELQVTRAMRSLVRPLERARGTMRELRASF